LNQASLSPREEYLRRLENARELTILEDRRDARLADGRLAVFLVAGGVGLAAFWLHWLSSWWLLIPGLAFVGLVVLHDQVIKARDRARELSALYERGLARVDDQWIGIGRDGARFLEAHHPYSADLDLFGPGSMFQRLSMARTTVGERRLADWLLTPAEPTTIRERQEAVEELANKLDFRESLARSSESIGDCLDSEGLAHWAAHSERIPLGLIRLVAILFAIVATLAVCGWLALDLDPRIVFAVLAIEGGFAFAVSKPVGRILEAVDRRAEDLTALACILERIEGESFESPALVTLRQRLMGSGHTASSRIAHVRQLVDRLEWGRNMVFAPFAIVWLWGTQVGLSVESWRRKFGKNVREWVEVAAEFEAFASLSAYRFENPDDPFPTIRETDGGFVSALGMGHPLLPKASCVRNDLALGGELQVMVISGSNMSGKSTCLRALGSNVVLALAGGPVKAHEMSLSPLAIGATLRVQDSLQTGTSRFYAEILRIRQVVDLSRGALPLLFLLDEVLAGTNSHDRLEGASAVVKGLIERGAIGLVTTHDLALAEVADSLAPRAKNVHFEDQFSDGVMRFDYVMRPGVVRKSNALELMRAIGLEV
jgi:hypothetical protein